MTWMLAAGVGYWLLSLNPMSGLIEAHRHSILGYMNINFTSLGIWMIVIVLIFLSGMFYFKRVERYFADII